MGKRDEQSEYVAAAPTRGARGRAIGRTANERRQTDSLAITVELLEELLHEQQQTNALLGQLVESAVLSRPRGAEG